MTEANTEHPSFLVLDRHCVGLETADEERAHIAACEQCRSYVQSYQPAIEVPAWVSTTATAVVREYAGPRGASRKQRWWTFGGLTAAAAAICLTVLWPRTQNVAYDGVKGAPSVGVHVQRGGVAGLWDGTPLSPGDRIRLEVMPQEFDHVSVFALDSSLARPTARFDGAESLPSRLYTGRVVPGAPTVLPKAWQLDDAAGAEHLLVILAKTDVSPAAAAALMRAHDPSEVWLVRLRLPKQSGSR
jgi:hypothetical protein